MNNFEVKPWWQSTTIWSALGVLLLALAPYLGLSTDDANGAGAAVHDLVTSLLALLAIWGRIRAEKRILPA